MSSTTLRADLTRSSPLRPALARAAIGLALVGGATAGIVVGARSGVPTTDLDLLRLLRAMAMLKLLFVAAAAAVMLWRLQSPVSPLRLGGYVAACAAMAAGPGLLWTMAHVGTAALLLHGGVAVSLLLLWQDSATAALLEHTIARRRSVRRVQRSRSAPSQGA